MTVNGRKWKDLNSASKAIVIMVLFVVVVLLVQLVSGAIGAVQRGNWTHATAKILAHRTYVSHSGKHSSNSSYVLDYIFTAGDHVYKSASNVSPVTYDDLKDGNTTDAIYDPSNPNASQLNDPHDAPISQITDTITSGIATCVCCYFPIGVLSAAFFLLRREIQGLVRGRRAT